jgi:excisionase family DNA binding protein
LSKSELARALGVSPKTVERWEESGKIRKAARDRNNYRFWREDDVPVILKWMQSERAA